MSKIKKDLAELRIDRKHLKSKTTVDWDKNGVPFDVKFTPEENKQREIKLNNKNKEIAVLEEEYEKLAKIPREQMPIASVTISIFFPFKKENWKDSEFFEKNKFKFPENGVNLYIHNRRSSSKEQASFINNGVMIYLGNFDGMVKNQAIAYAKVLIEHELIHWIQENTGSKWGMPKSKSKTPEYDYLLKNDTDEEYALTDFEFWPNIKDEIARYKKHYNMDIDSFIKGSYFFSNLKKYPKKYNNALKEFYKGISS